MHAWDLPVPLMNTTNVFKGTVTLSLSSFPLPPLQAFSFISELTDHAIYNIYSLCVSPCQVWLQLLATHTQTPHTTLLTSSPANTCNHTSPVPFSALHTTNRIARPSNFYFSLFCKFFFHQFFCLLISIESDLTNTLLLLSEQNMSSVQVLFPLNLFLFPKQPLLLTDIHRNSMHF